MNPRTPGLIALLAFTVLLGAACGEGDLVEESGANAVILDLAQTPGLSEFQRGLLDDGRLTFPEYERAIFRAVDCLEGAGFLDIRTELRSEDRGYTIDFAYPGAEITPADETAQQACYDDSLSAVEFAFAEANRPSEDELENLQRRSVECAREILDGAGMETAGDPVAIVERARELDADRLVGCAIDDS